MNSETQTYIINGKKTVGPAGMTVADAKHLEPLIGIGGDQFLGVDPTTGTMLKLAEGDRLEPGRQYQTIPPIVKG